jgi:hypothetical protein
MMPSLSQTFGPPPRDPQCPFDAAVVLPTLLRPSLTRAVQSVFRQRFAGTIQVLVGVDRAEGEAGQLAALGRECPEHCSLLVLQPGYSTSVRNGGLHPGGTGGVLRTVLSYLANSRRVAYLDDDNWWSEDHLRTLCDTLAGHDWAFSLRWYVEAATARPLCIDEWESVGPGRGVFNASQGGFVDPGSLMLDKLACEAVLRWWSIPLRNDPRAMTEDRHVFHLLSNRFRGAATNLATCFYTVHPGDEMQPFRQRWIAQKQSEEAAPG